MSEAALPPLYDRWMTELLGADVPGEPAANCDNCSMWAPTDVAEDDPRVFFKPSTKCCTFLPELPNYLVGGALADDDPTLEEGRASLRTRIKRGGATTPLGLGRKLSYALRYRHEKDSFGREEKLRCPHYLDDGRCGVWRHRNSTCSTWFCKHDRGLISWRFWRAMHHMLSVLERQLSAWCVEELDMMNDDVAAVIDQGVHPIWRQHGRFSTHLMGSQIDETRPSSGLLGGRGRTAKKKMWGDWYGKEDQFFIACHELVSPLSWEDIADIGGKKLRSAVRNVKRTHGPRMNPEVPTTLHKALFDVVQIGEHSALVQTYGQYDPLEIDKDLLESLERFDGRPRDEILDEVASQDGLQLSDGLVQRLFDHRLVVEFEPEET